MKFTLTYACDGGADRDDESSGQEVILKKRIGSKSRLRDRSGKSHKSSKDVQEKRPSERARRQSSRSTIAGVGGTSAPALLTSASLSRLTALEVHRPLNDFRRTGIVCTIGPASSTVETLQHMINSGMCVARLNFSHGTHDYHKKSIEKVRDSVDKMQPKPIIAIALDTKGPEIRTGMLEGGGNKDIPLKKGEPIRVTTNDEFKDKCSDKVLYLDYKNLAKVLQPEKLIYIGDGLICLRVDKIDDDSNLTCTIMNEAGLGSKKSCNLPGTDIDLPAVSQKDEEDLKFGVAEGVDMIFASFIRDAAGVSEIRKCLGEEGKRILIISKIENMQGIKNIDEIIEASDGVMVARGDMGQEIPLYEVVVAQKMIIAKCNRAGKPVICATQMLESMVKCPRPTRAEASDVPNAVLDGADCVMLSGETAKGDYPVECVSTMNNLCRSAENIFNYDQHAQEIKNMGKSSQQAFLALAAAQTATICGASAVVVVSEDGREAHKISNFRPNCPIILATSSESVARQSRIWSGLVPFVVGGDGSDKVDLTLQWLKNTPLYKQYTNVVTVFPSRPGTAEADSMRVISV